MKNLSPIVKYVFITPWCLANKLEWYNVIILLAHISGMANNVVSFSDVSLSLSLYITVVGFVNTQYL